MTTDHRVARQRSCVAHPLNYRPESIFETFYAWNVNEWTTVTFDYQFIANPAYNADRGPVSLFAARARAEF
jgi:high affinity Mn2+ porin